jgi:hypothetical protein
VVKLKALKTNARKANVLVDITVTVRGFMTVVTGVRLNLEKNE